MFSRTAAQDAKSRARASAQQAQAGAKQARASAKLAAGRARQATAQFTPLAKSAQLTVGRGVYGARVWAAPRVERTGVAVQERLAPRVSSMMTEAARRMQPSAARPRRRWPFIVGGIGLLAAGGAAAAVLRSQRKSAAFNEPAVPAPTPMPAPGQPPASPELGETAQADVNGQVRTP